jgi:hypothetical protein
VGCSVKGARKTVTHPNQVNSELTGPPWRGSGETLKLVLLALSLASGTRAQQLTVSGVAIPLGVADAPIVRQLRHDRTVHALKDGWELRPGAYGSRQPHVRIRVKEGTIREVVLIWGPPYTPDADSLMAHLVEALPSQENCVLRTGSGRLEGGTRRRISWECDHHTGQIEMGVWSSGRAATMSIALASR